MITLRGTLQISAAAVVMAAIVTAQQPSQPPAAAGQTPAQQPAATASAAATKCPAPTPPATLSDWSFSGKTGVLLHQVPKTKVQDFETFLGHFRDALAKSTDPIVREQAKGWRIYRDEVPGPNNDVVYMFLLDPAVPCVDYGPGRILAGAISDQAELSRVWNLFNQSVRQTSLMDLTPAGTGAVKTDRAPATQPATTNPPAGQTAPAPAVPLDASPTRPPQK